MNKLATRTATCLLILTLCLSASDSVLAQGKGRVVKRTQKARVTRTAGLSQRNMAAARSVSMRVAKQMVSKVQELSKIEGSGFERYGQGDARIIQRRNLLSQLQEQTLVPMTVFSASAKKASTRAKTQTKRSSTKPIWLTKDLDALSRVERTDAMKNPGKSSGFATLDEVWLRVDKASKLNSKRAGSYLRALATGSKSYFAVDNIRCSTAIISQIKDPHLRARTMVDMILQFRDATDKSKKFEELRVGGTGVQAIMEMRQQARWVSSRKGSATAERDYALMRALVTSNPRTSSNAVLEARNLMGELRRHSWQLVYGPQATQPGYKVTPYEAIHRNFSTQTAMVIRDFVGKTVFGGGNAETFCGLVDAMNAARKGDAAKAQRLLAGTLNADTGVAAKLKAFQRTAKMARKPLDKQIESFLVSRSKGKLDSTDYKKVKSSLIDDQDYHLKMAGVGSAKGNYAEKFNVVTKVYRAVVNSTPTAATLSEKLFSAKGAHLHVSNVIAHLERGARRGDTQTAIAEARSALRKEFSKQRKGFVRVNMWTLDRQLDSLHAKLLGSTVDKIGNCKTRGQQLEAVTALHSALKGAVASGLHQMRDFKDANSRKGGNLRAALKDVGQLKRDFAAGKVSLSKYQSVMSRASEAIVRCTENIQSYFESRIPHVEQGKLVPNVEFFDNFIKDSPLHYAAAIAQKASSVGLKTTMTNKQIVNPKGVTVLNRLGRVVFDRLMVGDSLDGLAAKGAGRNDFGWVRTRKGVEVDEKKMVIMGGVMAGLPGGFSHAANFSRGAGMAAISNPNVSGKWLDFAKRVGKDKVYYDDRGGRLVMMPLREALAKGLVKSNEVSKLRPGNNRKIKYYQWSERQKKWNVAGKHEVKVNPTRRTNTVEIFNRADRVRGFSASVMSFQQIGKMGTDARALVGEKGLLLGLMSVHKQLGHRTPPGAAITSVGVKRLLSSSGVLKAWMQVWDKDPKVGKVNDKNFLKSRFYKDGKYREATRTRMLDLVDRKLTAHLLKADGTPTRAGRALLRSIEKANPELIKHKSWIARSAFTAEDRPFKSSAGQYDSFPALKTDGAKLKGIIGVVKSAWNKRAIDNTVAEQYNLRHIWPTIPIMKSIDAKKSGVMVTRDTETGYRRTISYQAVKGFGGGVDGGHAEEGKVSERGLSLSKLLPGTRRGIVTKRMGKQLYNAGMIMDKLFTKVVEPGKGYPLDMEWVVDKQTNKLWLVQARTIPIN